MFYERNFQVLIHTARILHAETSWILEDNAEMINGSRMMLADHYKTYRFYERDL